MGSGGAGTAGRRVDLGADLPDLAIMVREHAELAHGDEGRGEVGEELARRRGGGGVGLARDVGAGGGIEEECGVGGEEALVAGDEGVVVGVEGGRRGRVEVDERGVVAGLALPAEGAGPALGGCELCIGTGPSKPRGLIPGMYTL